MESGEGYQVVFVIGIDVQEGVTDLFDVDRAGEGGLLGIVALELSRRLALMISKRVYLQGLELAYSDAVPIVPNAVGSNRWVMAIFQSVQVLLFPLVTCCPYLTCSDTKCVVPASSSHRPRYSSPRNGLSGFFSVPSFSLLLA